MKLQNYLARLVLVCVAPVVLLAAGFAYEKVREAERTEQRVATDLVFNVAATIDRHLQSPIGALLIMAQSPGLQDPAHLEESYAHARSFHEAFDTHLILATPAGQMLLNTRVPLGRPLPHLPTPTGRSALEQALATGRPAVGDQVLGPVAKVPLVAMAVPVLHDGRVAGVLVATHESAHFQRTLDGLALPADWGLRLRDSSGTTIAYRGPDPTRRLEASISAIQRLALAPWTLEISRPRGLASAAIVNSALVLTLMILAAVGAALLAGQLASRRLYRAFATLADMDDAGSTSADLHEPVAEVDAIRRKLRTAEAQRLASEHRYVMAFRTSPDAMTITRLPGGQYWDINQGFTRMFGWTRDEVIGRTPFDLALWLDLDQRQRLLAVIARDGECANFETQFRTKDGRIIAAMLSSNRMQLGDEQFLLTVTRDITAHKADEGLLRELSLAVEQSAAIVIITDRNSRIEYVNEAFIRQTGYTRAEAIGRIPSELLGSGRTPGDTYAEMYRVLANGEAWQGEFVNRTKDGREVVNRARVSPLFQPDGTITHYVAVQDDITEALQLNAELQSYRLHLEELVEQRTQEVAVMRDELAKRATAAEAASVAKSTFLANMSHEIRTPMNAILGFAHLLKRSELTAEQSDRVRKLAAAGEHLLLLINNILDLSKIEAGKLALEDVDFSLPVLLEDVRSLVGVVAHERGLRIVVDAAEAPQWLRGDATRLQQALVNFAGNAVKFTERGSVTLRARVLREEVGRVLLRCEVQDTGIGIPSELIPELFQPFQQLNTATTRRFGGTGLGLAITQRIAALMGGEAGVESTVGVGSTFWFTAWLGHGDPLDSPEETLNQASAEHELRTRYAGARVLLAEDNEVNQEVAVALLSRTGLVVDVAANGAEALARAGAGYDVILMDIHMPEMDGLEATQQIRALPGGAAIPIIAMTADAFDDDRGRCAAAGMNDFIGKPVVPLELYGTLLRWLARGKSSTQ